MADTTLIAEQEDAARAIADAMYDDYVALREQYGDRPIGGVKPSRWDLLDHYISMADDPMAWMRMYYERGAEIGLEAAIGEAIRSDFDLNERLEKAGGWQAVRMHQDEVLARNAIKAMATAERQKVDGVVVRAPLPPQAQVSLLTGQGPESVDTGMGVQGPPVPAQGQESLVQQGV
jgi:hypothetical protein